MSARAEQLSVALDRLRPHERTRREPRTPSVRILEYTPFPRRAADGGPRIGFTRDVSPSGLCFGADSPEAAGALLRVTLRDLDGQLDRPGVARVVWCSPARDGRYWIGLERLDAPDAAREAI